MQYLVVLALVGTAFISTQATSFSVKPRADELFSRSTVLNYDIFKLAAATFIASNPVNGSYTWVNLKNLNTSTFSGNGSMPSSWSMVVYGPGQYVVCTDHKPQDISFILSRVTGAKAPYVKTTSELVTATDRVTAEAQAGNCP